MTVIDESLTARGFTPRAQVPLVYGRARTIDFYTIHWWGSYGQTHDGVNNFFVNGPGLTSAHFVASANRLNCLVNPWDAAWHAGNAVGNAASVGIECRPEGSDADYKTVAELLRFLYDTYGVKPLRPHNYWQATQCPGTYDLARLDKMAKAMNTTEPTPIQPKPITGEIVDIEFTREQPAKTAQGRRLAAGLAWFLKESDMANNWNIANGSKLGYYDVDMFIRGRELSDGGRVTVQIFIVTGTGGERNLAGYFTQDIEGSADGSWNGNIRFKSPLLSTARLEVAVTATEDCLLDTWGSDSYLFTK